MKRDSFSFLMKRKMITNMSPKILVEFCICRHRSEPKVKRRGFLK